jgi:tetratricopeptide (TPR) repeat protein
MERGLGYQELDLRRSGGLAVGEAHWGTPLTSDGPVPLVPGALVSALQDRFEFLHELGSGGMATVYLARDIPHDYLVAIKVLRPDLVPVLGAERFAREIRITSYLRHPNILPVLDSGEVDGLPFYVTPYIEGQSLAQRLEREQQLSIEDALDIACQVADALAVAHAEGFIHRDIKPSNILLKGQQAILTDFGIARAVDVVTAEKLTESGLALGTPAYMSPEQSACGSIDGRSDIYSLACVLFEMLAGSPPFTGPSAQSVRARHAVDPPPPVRTVRHSVTPSLERVIDKALEKVAADRYPGALQFKEALQALDLNERVTAEAPSSRRRPAIRTAAVLAALATGTLTWHLALPKGRNLDVNRVMVYPLVLPAGFTGPQTIGEDLATMIGGALDGTGPLRWIDGWPILAPRQREDIRTVTQEDARSLARSKGCGYFLTGRVVALGDSVQIFLELNDVLGDSTVARGRAEGPAKQAWSLGLKAVNDVLPRLIPTDTPDIVNEWKNRNPAAIASFLLGESAFRRVHLSEALNYYRAAIRTDSLFGFAAVRGAQAAVWSHRPNEAASLIQVALRQPMAPRYSHFALGYEAYLEGRADSAAAEFRRVLALDPDMAVAWMQLGEVYTHLLPVAGNPETEAKAAFEEAHRLDPSATYLLLHLIEIRLRKGDIERAQPIIRQFLAADPEPMLAKQIQIMDACVRQGPAAVDWAREAATNTLSVLAAGKLLAVGGTRLDCAMPAFSAVIQADTTAIGDSRWYALLQLQAALLAQGQVSRATEQVDSRPPQEVASVMYLLDAPLFPELSEKAAEVARKYKAECGPGFANCPNPYRVWQLGLWDAYRGHIAEAELAARELVARAKRNHEQDSQLLSLLGRSVAAHAALARSDTVTALAMFDALIREPVPGGEGIEWDLGKPRGLDRLRLSELLLARGQAEQALAVADVFDSSAPSIYLLYLRESLRLRVSAASALGDVPLGIKYQNRLAALRSDRTFVTRTPKENVI